MTFDEIVSARHSSRSLLKAGWKPAMDILRPFKVEGGRGGSGGERLAYNKNLARLGTAIPAKEGWVCQGMIENHVGQGGTLLDTRQRTALLRYGEGPFRRALSEEADGMIAATEKYLAADAARFKRQMS